MEKRIESDWLGWKVVRKIGNGSKAVYEIERDLLGKKEHSALKVIAIPESAEEIEALYNEGYDIEAITNHFADQLKNFVKEYSFMYEMRGHENIVYCDDLRYVKQENDIGWYVYIKTEILDHMTNVIGADYNEESVIKLATDIANALSVCKNHNIVHRDIKPQTIFVSADGVFKLGDFGMAKVSEKTEEGTKIGTPDYMAPEVYFNKPYGATADIYSLGLVLYWLMNGRKLPFLSTAVSGYAERIKAREKLLNGEQIPDPVNGSEGLKKIVLRACAHNPEDRYQSAKEMLEDLASLANLPAVEAEEIVPEAEDDGEKTIVYTPEIKHIEEDSAEVESVVEEASVVEETPVVEEAPVAEEIPVVEEAPEKGRVRKTAIKLTAKAVAAEPVAEPVVEPVAEPIVEPAVEPAIEAVVEAVEPVVEPDPIPAVEKVESILEDAVKSADEELQSVEKPAAEPVAEPVVEPVTEPAVEPVVEPVAEIKPEAKFPDIGPDTDKTMRVRRPISDVNTKSEPAKAEPAVKPAAEPVIEKKPEPKMPDIGPDTDKTMRVRQPIKGSNVPPVNPVGAPNPNRAPQNAAPKAPAKKPLDFKMLALIGGLALAIIVLIVVVIITLDNRSGDELPAPEFYDEIFTEFNNLDE